MIPPDVRARIRRLHFAEHWKVGTIATELGVHHGTVARAITPEIAPAAPVRSSVVDPYKVLIQQTLDGHPKLRATRLYDMIQSRGYTGSVVHLRRYVRKIRPTARAEAYLRLTTLPGEQGQVDWGNFGKIRIGHARRTLSCFVLVLSWSRAVYARFALDETLESFLRGHVEAFAALGGVPRTLLYDNLKTAVLDRVGSHIRFHPRLLDLAGHYQFEPKPCAPYRGNEKGKVERTIQYLRHSFFAARRYGSIDDLNAQLAEWIERLAHGRKVPGNPAGHLVRDALADERTRLLPLPEHPFECAVVRGVSSGKTPYVRFDQNDYSIPHDRVRRPLTLIASERLVRIVDGTTEITRHARSYDHGCTIEDPAHIAALAKQKRKARELTGRDRLRAACKHADDLIDTLARRGVALGPQTARLLKMLDRYGATRLDAAIHEAVVRGAPGAESVAHLLDQHTRAAKAPPPLDVMLSDDPRVRDLRVTPHALDPYDALSNDDDSTKETE